MISVRSIEITFPIVVTLTQNVLRGLDALVGVVCDDYQRAHPDRVMWPAEFGARPLPSFVEGGAPPHFDETVHLIGCAEGEDLHGNNPHNPRRDALKAAAAAASEEQRVLQLAADRVQFAKQLAAIDGLTEAQVAAVTRLVLGDES